MRGFLIKYLTDLLTGKIYKRNHLLNENFAKILPKHQVDLYIDPGEVNLEGLG